MFIFVNALLLSSCVHFGCIEQIDSTLVGDGDEFFGDIVGDLPAKGNPSAKAELRDAKAITSQVPKWTTDDER